MPELRKDPLVGRWVIISTERAKRPDEFSSGGATRDGSPADCPFCEKNEGKTQPEIMAFRKPDSPPNSPGWRVRVVPSISPLLRIEGKLEYLARGLYDVCTGTGAHEIVVETPQHISSTAELSQDQIALVLDAYVQRMKDLEKDPRFKYVLLFKNHGLEAGGGKYHHSLSQLIALPVNPVRLKDELQGARMFFEMKERCIFCDILRQELDTQQRIAVETAHFVALAPFASRFPFELWILPKEHSSDFVHLSPEARIDLARIMKLTLSKLSKTLNDPPYNYILHTAPFRRPHTGYWRTIEQDFHWHLEVMPRLTRVAGFEWGTGFYINPTSPEEAARFLKEAEIPAPSHG